jgi:hypothetical protein
MGRDVKGFGVLRQRCAARLPSLDLPIPFDLELFCRSLGERRQRPIVLRPIDIPTGLGGFWVASTQSDYILYQAGARPLHRLHIILHELSHLICEHQPRPVTEAEFLQIMLPDLSAQAFQHMLNRGAYSTAEDQEAEILATLILARVTHSSYEGRAVDQGAPTGLVGRLADSLGNSSESSP